MKKLLIPLMLLATAFWPALHTAQKPTQKGGGTDVHEARFVVFRHLSRIPVPGAEISDSHGAMLGNTDVHGSLVLALPASANEVYVVKAEGYSVMTMRLTQAQKRSATYEVFLQELSTDATPAETVDMLPTRPKPGPEEDLVKVYVRQDPPPVKKNISPDAGQELLFAVQLSATSRPITDKKSLSAWEAIGPVFIQSEDGLYKVRIGPYTTQEQAKQALLQVKGKGRKDAFIVVQQGREAAADDDFSNRRQPVKTTAPEPAPAPETSTAGLEEFTEETGVEYKVRLASYLKPGGFNTRDIDQYGTLETYRQGEWTIMLIGGLASRAEAEKIKELVIAKGFRDARVVIDRGGILEDAPK